MSVVMWAVTPSIKLDGRNAHAIHIPRRFQLGDGSSTSAISSATARRPGRTIATNVTIATANRT